MSVINRIFGIGCAVFVKIVIHYVPDGEIKHVLVGVFLGAGALALINILDEFLTKRLRSRLNE